MRAIILFFLTCFVATMTLLAGLAAKNPFPNFLIGFGLWALYAWYLSGHIRRRQTRRRQAWMREECMRLYLRKNRYY